MFCNVITPIRGEAPDVEYNRRTVDQTNFLRKMDAGESLVCDNSSPLLVHHGIIREPQTRRSFSARFFESLLQEFQRYP